MSGSNQPGTGRRLRILSSTTQLQRDLAGLSLHDNSLEDSPFSPDSIPAQTPEDSLSIQTSSSTLFSEPIVILTPPVDSQVTDFVDIPSDIDLMANSNPTFYGKGANKEDPEEYIETIEIIAMRQPADSRSMLCRSIFREGLRSLAKDWYGPLNKDIRRN